VRAQPAKPVHPRHAHRPKGLLTVLTIAVVVGIVSLILSVQNALDQREASNQRERDRIESDLASCQRGNVFRQQVIDLGSASDTTMTQILDTIFASTTRPEAQELRRQLDVPLVDFRTTVRSIHLIDCQAAVPGAKEKP
jgi:hypothetical protein